MTVSLKVSDISASSPDMDNEQFQNLVDDIRKHGQLVPIWKSGDEIIDGRKRARACSILGIAVRAVNVSADMDQAELSRSLNILRTHYTASQRAIFAAKMTTATKADGAKFRNTTKVKFDLGSPKTRSEAAREAGVSVSGVREAKKIIREGAPEVVEAIEAGNLSLHSAEQIVDNVPKQHQAEAVKEKLSAPRRSDGFIIGKSTKPARLPTRPVVERMVRCLDQLENAVELIGQFIEEEGAKSHANHSSWVKRIFKARTALSRIIKNQGGYDE